MFTNLGLYRIVKTHRGGKNMFFKRHIKARLIELLNDFRIVYLTGPRQAGKSTLAREIAKEQGMG